LLHLDGDHPERVRLWPLEVAVVRWHRPTLPAAT
jgi:hypothetical protein